MDSGIAKLPTLFLIRPQSPRFFQRKTMLYPPVSVKKAIFASNENDEQTYKKPTVGSIAANLHATNFGQALHSCRFA
jgi:hypothetical protein